MILNYFEVLVIADCEGRSRTRIASFYNEHDAHAFAECKHGRDMYGRPGTVHQNSMTIYKDIVEALEESNAKISGPAGHADQRNADNAGSTASTCSTASKDQS